MSAQGNSISVSLISEINCTDGSCREKTIENIFLRLLGFRTFSHSLGHKRTFRDIRRMSALPVKSGLNDTAKRCLLPAMGTEGFRRRGSDALVANLFLVGGLLLDASSLPVHAP
jgi:hypothetical protein